MMDVIEENEALEWVKFSGNDTGCLSRVDLTMAYPYTWATPHP
jgi:hypothetical protein